MAERVIGAGCSVKESPGAIHKEVLEARATTVADHATCCGTRIL